MFLRRAPQGARGLKYKTYGGHYDEKGRAPQGARGLKCYEDYLRSLGVSRAPQGARGLKSGCQGHSFHCLGSRPARGARIEIAQFSALISAVNTVAPRKGRED